MAKASTKKAGKGLSVATAGVVVSDKKAQLLACEKVIHQCWRESTVCLGTQLRTIQDEELYKADGYAKWEEYVQKRWNTSPAHARRLMAASDAYHTICAAHIVCDDWSSRALMEFSPIYKDDDKVRDVANKVVAYIANNPTKKVTAALVGRLVKGEKTPNPDAPEKKTAGTADKTLEPKEVVEALKKEYNAARDGRKQLETLMNADKEAWPAFVDSNQKTLKIAVKAYRETADQLAVWLAAHAKTVVEA